MIDFIKNFFGKYGEIVKYGTIGVFCSGLDFLVFMILTHFFDISYLHANLISVHCGIFASFFLNRQFTFKIKNKMIIRFFSFYLIGLLGLLISSWLLVLFIGKLALNKIISKLMTIVVVALMQFLLNKYVSFKHAKQ